MLRSCKELENALSFNGKFDIDSEELHSELIVVSSLVKDEKLVHIIDVLNIIQKYDMENVVPNVVIALRISLTVPVSVATGERSFSKLKIIKNYLRNNMNEERLNELSIISIEKDLANAIPVDDIIDDFAASKERKKKFN